MTPKVYKQRDFKGAPSPTHHDDRRKGRGWSLGPCKFINNLPLQSPMVKIREGGETKGSRTTLTNLSGGTPDEMWSFKKVQDVRSKEWRDLHLNTIL